MARQAKHTDVFSVWQPVLRQKHIYLKTIDLSKAISDLQQHAQGLAFSHPLASLRTRRSGAGTRELGSSSAAGRDEEKVSATPPTKG